MADPALHLDLEIRGMTCASCVSHTRGALEKVPGVASASVNLATGRAHVALQPDLPASSGALTSALLAAVARAGYQANLVPPASEPRPSEIPAPLPPPVNPARQLTPKLIVALVAAACVSAAATVHASPWLELALTLPLVFWAGAAFYRRAWSALRRRTSDMNTLIATGTGAAFLLSLAATLDPNLFTRHGVPAQVYYEAVAWILALILLGNFFEARARGRATAAIQSLWELQPAFAHRIENDVESDFPTAQLTSGMVVRVRAGESIPADGIVRAGSGAVDESLLTGEALPVAKQPGDSVTGGTRNDLGSFEVTITATGAATVLAGIVRLVEAAQADRAPVLRWADRVAAIFVPLVLGIAALTFAVWLGFGPRPLALGLPHALIAAVSVLVIACPCALGLAVPTAIMTASARAARAGVFLREGAALERIAGLRTIVFDKTGTLTQGRPQITAITPAGAANAAAVLTAAAAVEAGSEHPLASAIRRAAQGQLLPAVTAFAAQPGRGASAVISGQTVHVGSAARMRELRIEIPAAAAVPGPETLVYVARGSQLLGVITIADPVKTHAAQVVSELRQRGLAVVLLTGDTAATAQAVARELAITEVFAEVLPAEKAAVITRLQAHGPVAMVGDGINDAPALAAADLGIALGTGTEIAMQAAQITLMSGDLRGILRALALGRRTQRIIRQNLFWAFGYNLVGIPLAAGLFYPFTGWLLSPVFASAAMAFSSVAVVSNSLRLTRS